MIRSTPNAGPKPASTAGPYRTVGGWALGVLVECGAVTECDHHGHRRDAADPDAWKQVLETARHSPFPGATYEASIRALEEVIAGIGDTCPDC